MPNTTTQANLWGIDNRLKTPYADAVDLSIGRELPKALSLGAGSFSRLVRATLSSRQ